MASVARFILWVLVGFLALQLLVAMALIVSNRRRRQRVPQSGFPHINTPPVTVDNASVQIYTEGSALVADMLQAIAQAQKTIHFETYIWKHDILGQRFKDALIARAEAGVQVHIIYDVFGNMVVPQIFKRFPPSLHVLPFWPLRSPGDLLRPRRFRVDHRKILVVDGQIGFMGGYNIGDLYRTEWRDTHVRFQGAAARDLGYAFADFWNNHVDEIAQIPTPVRPWSPTIRFHRNDPGRMSYPIRAIFLEAVEHAQSHILITNAYFIPDPGIRMALLRAAQRGVEVQLLVPWNSNHVVADWLARHYFSLYLRHGIRLFGYQGAMIHAKTATIDGVWSMIGTANMDRLSLAGNYEINVEIFDPEIARQMEEIFACDLTNSQEISLERWEERSPLARLGELILSPLWPWA